MPSIDFDLRQLEIFCKVVDLGSFSKAADAVFLAQASVSERIANLERTVGTRLLDRLGREVIPTKAGELLYKHALLLLEMKKRAQQEMESFLGVKQGEIHLGGSTIPGEYILPEVIGHFRENYPFVSVTLEIGDTSEIEERILQGIFELGVIGSRSKHKELIHHELWQDELVLAVPLGHQLAKRKMVSLEELYQEPFILREVGSGTLKILEDYLEGSKTKDLSAFQVAARLGTSTAVKEGIKAGLGISILSSRAIDTELKLGILRALRVEGIPMVRSFYLIRDKRRVASPICQAFVDYLLKTAGDESK
ncbi:selenium metabolism-associated LysR family transcriptional regulator [Thermodesulfobacteriota bacterium]